MYQDISLDILGHEKNNLYRDLSTEDSNTQSSSRKHSVDHVTPDNLTRKLQLHKKTELSDFFEFKQGNSIHSVSLYTIFVL